MIILKQVYLDGVAAQLEKCRVATAEFIKNIEMSRELGDQHIKQWERNFLFAIEAVAIK